MRLSEPFEGSITMFKQIVPVLALIAAIPASARTPECTNLDKAHWITQEGMRAKLAWQGNKVLEFSVTDSCYKVRLEDKDGRRIEAYYDPVGGQPVRRQVM